MQSQVKAQTVSLTYSGPISTSRNKQVISNLLINSRASDTNGITVNHDDVIIRNVKILHAGGHGIFLRGADRTRIENADIRYTNAPLSGANKGEHNNIKCHGSADVVITRVRLRDGSSGVHTTGCRRVHVSFVEGYNFRGPFPRGQVVQFDTSNDATLEDFYTKNDINVAWTEDNVNSWHSSNTKIRRGLVDGNNSPSGVGVIFEHSSVANGGLVEDVDAVRMGNGCFSAADAHNVTFRNVRCQRNVCGKLGGRGASLSNSLMFHSYQNTLSDNIRYYSAKYNYSCNGNISWDQRAMAVKEFARQNYTQRAPVILTFPWE
jgi:hypothetical protein